MNTATPKPSAIMGGFTPIFDCVVQDVGLVGASVFGRMWRYCQGDRKACQASTSTIAESLNMSTRTVIRWQQELKTAGYLHDTTPELRNKPHTYRVTNKVTIQVSINAVTESHSTMTESHSHYDRKSLEETFEETFEETNFTPSSGEKPEPKNVPDLADELFGHVQESEPPKAEGPTYLERVRKAAGGDPVAGAAFIAQTATDAPMSVPAEAGGQDDWIRVAEAFCCLQGLALSDMPPKAQKQWPRKLQSIAEGAGASPAQTIEAIRAMPDTELAFKVSGYTTPYKRSFEDDVQMVIAKIATGQIVPKSGVAPSATAMLAKNGYNAERIKLWAQQKQLQATI